MLDTLISSKTRLHLLYRFFLNPEAKGYLRGLERELGENSNALRLELNRFEDAGLLRAEWEGPRKWFAVNRDYPLFAELHTIALKRFGIDQVVEKVLSKIGPVEAVYLTGSLAAGRPSDTIEVLIVAEDLNRAELDRLASKAETLIGRRIACTCTEPGPDLRIPEPSLLLL